MDNFRCVRKLIGDAGLSHLLRVDLTHAHAGGARSRTGNYPPELTPSKDEVSYYYLRVRLYDADAPIGMVIGPTAVSAAGLARNRTDPDRLVGFASYARGTICMFLHQVLEPIRLGSVMCPVILESEPRTNCAGTGARLPPGDPHDRARAAVEPGKPGKRHDAPASGGPSGTAPPPSNSRENAGEQRSAADDAVFDSPPIDIDFNQLVKTKSVFPRYPSTARSRGVEGRALVEVVCSPQGEVMTIRWLEGHMYFRESIYRAVMQWRFLPRSIAFKFQQPFMFQIRH